MSTSKPIAKLTRKQLEQALDTVPVSSVLGARAARELTPKQRKFAMEVAKGAKGAEAYRKAYNTTGKPKTHGDHASRLKARASIQAEIDAYRLALEAAEYRTPAALRALVVQTLTQTLLDGDVAPAVRVQAARVLGTVTEVAAFTERREVRTVNDTAQAREALLDEIRDLMRTVDMPATADADSLMAELAPESVAADPHPDPAPHDGDATHHGDRHSTPHTQSQIPDEPPTPSDCEHPPVDGTENTIGGDMAPTDFGKIAS